MDALVDGVSYLLVAPESETAGFYHGDTRHLTPLSVSVEGADLTRLDDRYRRPSGRTAIAADVGSTVNEVSGPPTGKRADRILERRQRVTEGHLEETIALHHTDGGTWTPRVEVGFDADFADIFEVRGIQSGVERAVDGGADDRTVRYTYTYGEAEDDHDGARRLETRIEFEPRPDALRPGCARFEPTLEGQATWSATVVVEPGEDHSTVRATTGEGATPASAAGTNRVDPFAVDAAVQSGDDVHDRTLAQARRDLRSLTTRTEHGLVPLAGAPWFVTVFGRDSLLTALQTLPFAPALARGTLRYLAANQGTADGDGIGEAPGRVLHEVRSGELARTRPTPATRSYLTVDATPLWVALLGETWRWTGDDDLVAALEPHLEAAVSWLERRAAAAGDDPFVYYQEFGTAGVVHKTWRDSAHGVQFADGSQATPPLASAAVQGLAYRAYRTAADLHEDVLGDLERARALRERAGDLRERFDDAFWMPDREYYATALTGSHEHVDSLTSNIGHCLWSGIVPPSRAGRLADLLVGPGLFSGWGVRTTSANETGYRPISYHAGSVWPHDNAVAAMGLARYGHHEAARRIASSQLSAFARFDCQSVPELFCGFDADRPPVPYPAACRPQAWSAAAPFGLLRALFALSAPSEDGPLVGSEPASVATDAIHHALEYWR